MRKQVSILFIIAVSLLALALACGGKKKKNQYMPPGAAVPPGSLVWAKCAGGGGWDGGSGISALSDGSAIVTGYFNQSATFGAGEANETLLSSAGMSDIFIAKYNPDGTLAWAKSAGGGSDDWGYGISAFSDGSAIVTGSFDNTATFGAGEANETVLFSAGLWDICIAKYNPDGTLAWAKSAGGGSWDLGEGISTLSDGSAIVTGEFSGTAIFGAGEGNETVLSFAGGGDIFTAKYNADGTLAWAKSAGGPAPDYGLDISALSDGSAVVTGWFIDNSTFGAGEGNETVLTSAGMGDIFIAKYNPDGTLNWAKSGGGEFGEFGRGISALTDGSAIVTGDFGYSDGGNATFGAGEANETVLSSPGSVDIFIAKYNPDGTLAWAKSAGGGGSWDSACGISALPDGSAIVTGYFSSTSTFGAGEANETDLTSAGSADIFVAKYNPDGTLAWAKSARSGDSDGGSGISALSDGSALVTGYFTGTAIFGAGEDNETVLSSAGSADIFIAKFNP